MYILYVGLSRRRVDRQRAWFANIRVRPGTRARTGVWICEYGSKLFLDFLEIFGLRFESASTNPLITSFASAPKFRIQVTKVIIDCRIIRLEADGALEAL